jgi:ribosomal protein S18 acetylase RimI-like enzyme
MDVQVDGVWPGAVTLHRGWSLAESRPWNESSRFAHLRMLRGGSAFLDDCVVALADLGADGVLSPPLPRGEQRVWQQADFVTHARLRVLRRDLDHVPPPDHLVVAGSAVDLREALRIDALAFSEFWRFDRPAALEALRATPRSVIHVIRAPDRGLLGYAITGVSVAVAFLQRIAVDPAWQGMGCGRSLVRAAARWAKQAGASALVLNTQADNTPAIGLYCSEGFEVLGTGLDVLRRETLVADR